MTTAPVSAQRRGEARIGYNERPLASGFEQRAAERRARVVGGTVHSHDELDEVDFEFWQSCSGEERLEATWQLALDAITLKAHAEAPGPAEPAYGVRRRAG